MPAGGRAPALDDEDATAAAAPLRCAKCGHEITHNDAHIEVDGRHEHFFVNPHGYDFHVRCFRNAPGVVSTGPSSHEFTWFTGMTWQLSLCRGCTAHIGWIFRSPRRIFYALIRDGLVDGDANHH